MDTKEVTELVIAITSLVSVVSAIFSHKSSQNSKQHADDAADHAQVAKEHAETTMGGSSHPPPIPIEFSDDAETPPRGRRR